MSGILYPVVGIGVGQAGGVDAEERIVGEEERAAIGRTKRELNAIVRLPILLTSVLRPAVDIDCFGDSRRIIGRGSGEDVSDQCFAPTADLDVDCKIIVGAPVPVEDVLTVLTIPVPVDTAV